MVEIKRGVEAEQVRQSARYTLFVEGDSSRSIDPQVLDCLLSDRGVSILIRPLGHSSNLRSVARALRAYHPNYYFLIDRDHHEQDTVEKSWRDFPDEDTDNLLIWRRREIENYFLIPEYLLKSKYLRKSCSSEQLKECILETACERIFLDAANMVILKMKKELKQDWIELFEDNVRPEFGTREKAIEKLVSKHALAAQECDILDKLQRYPVVDLFEKLVEELCGGQAYLEFTSGLWPGMIRGKHVLPTVITKCFQVKDAKGRFLQGKERMMAVVKDLLRLPLEDQPDDFQELHKLLSERIKDR